MKVQLDKSHVQYSWKEQLSCSCSVDEGPIKNSEPEFIEMHLYLLCIAMCVLSVCVCVCGWVCVCVCGGGGGGDFRQPSPVICKSHEL